MMKKFAFLLSILLSAGTLFAAGGAAAIVAKKSNTGVFPFSEATQQNFMRDCSNNAHEQVCGCVLGKLQKTYSEADYLRLDASLRKGNREYKFESFITVAVEECDAEFEKFPSKITEKEARAYVDTLLKNRVKKADYVSNCSSGMKDFYGDKTSKKICGCAYDKVFADTLRLVQTVMNEGYPDDNDSWGFDYIVECAPEKITPEIEKSMIKSLNQHGIPMSTSKCIVNAIKQEYSFKSLVEIYRNNKDQVFAAAFMIMGAKCLGNMQ